MKKFLSVGLATIGSFILVMVIVFTVLQLVINNEVFINNEFTKLEVNKSMGMSNSDLVKSTMRLIRYMEGDVDSIHLEVTVNGEQMEMFALDQEVEHMKDVRTLYQTCKSYRDTGVLVMLVLFLLASVINFRKAPQTLSQGFLSGSFVALLGFGFIGTWAAMDFTSFWTFFHEALFWNNLWLFDASESRMINMLPEQMFSDITAQLFLYAGIALLLLIGLSILCLVCSSEGYRRRKAASMARKRSKEAAKRLRAKQKAEARAAAEKEKRLAEKRKKKAAAMAKRAEAEETARKAAEKAGRTAGQLPHPHSKRERTLDEAVLAAEGLLPEAPADSAAPQEEPEEPQPIPRELSEDEKLAMAAMDALRKKQQGDLPEKPVPSEEKPSPKAEKPLPGGKAGSLLSSLLKKGGGKQAEAERTLREEPPEEEPPMSPEDARLAAEVLEKLKRQKARERGERTGGELPDRERTVSGRTGGELPREKAPVSGNSGRTTRPLQEPAASGSSGRTYVPLGERTSSGNSGRTYIPLNERTASGSSGRTYVPLGERTSSGNSGRTTLPLEQRTGGVLPPRESPAGEEPAERPRKKARPEADRPGKKSAPGLFSRKPEKKSAKHGNVEDDTGFFDD